MKRNIVDKKDNVLILREINRITEEKRKKIDYYNNRYDDYLLGIVTKQNINNYFENEKNNLSKNIELNNNAIKEFESVDNSLIKFNNYINNDLLSHVNSLLEAIEKNKIMNNVKSTNRITGLDTVFLFYPDFENEFDLLEEEKFITTVNNTIVWNKSKKSLAEYFGNLKTKEKYKNWKIIEQLFNVSGLKHAYNTNGSAYDKKISKDYEKWLSIKSTSGVQKIP